MTSKKLTEQQTQYKKLDISRWEEQLFNHQRNIDYHIKKENELIVKILLAKKEVDKSEQRKTNIKPINIVVQRKQPISKNK